MKKIFTTMALATLFLGASAQGLTVTVDGNAVSNGGKATSSTVHAQEYNGMIMMWELKPVIAITPAADANVTVKVTNLAGGKVKYVNKDEAVPDISFCGVTVPGGMAGNCVPVGPGNESMPQSQIVDAGVTANVECYFMSTDFVNIVPEMLDCTAKIEIVCEGESEETFTFDLNMTYPDTGVKTIGADSANFTVAGGSIVADGEVEVYDLAGRRVANSGLNGMYIVRTAGKTAKVVVK